jgi:hypothetical protein
MLAELQVLLAGPSNAGLADPGHGAALSLARITVVARKPAKAADFR